MTPDSALYQGLPILTLRRLLTPRANMNAPIRDAFDFSSRKPMRRHFVSGFPRALLCLSQEMNSGVEIVTQDVPRVSIVMPHDFIDWTPFCSGTNNLGATWVGERLAILRVRKLLIEKPRQQVCGKF